MSKRNTARGPVRVVTSFFVPQAAAALPQPVVDALRSHAGNPLVKEVHILTESDTSVVSRLVSQVVSSKKFFVVRCEKRPPFSVLFSHAAGLFKRDPAPVAIMNADVSFAGVDDIQRASEALCAAAKRFGKAVLALTRHDKVDGEWLLTLQQSDGLPNTLSADCWMLSGPVDLAEADFYCLGHMNCDLMLAHDLVTAGHKIFNPCLDVKVIHHEEVVKDSSFYEQANASEENAQLLWKHAERHCNAPFSCFGIPWIKSTWLSSAFFPDPQSLDRKKIYALLPLTPRDDVRLQVMGLEIFAKQNHCDLICLSEEDCDPYFDLLKEVLVRSKSVYLASICGSYKSFIASALSHGLCEVENVAVASASYFLSSDLIKCADAAIVYLNRTEIRGLPRTIDGSCVDWIGKRYNVWDGVQIMSGRVASCTLITTAFKSDLYLEKFFSNCGDIYLYNEKIDHLVFVTRPSPTEADLLLRQIEQNENTLIFHHAKDPGLYECWNRGLKLARTWYVSNANVDDLRHPFQLWKLIDQLEKNPDCCVAASGVVPFQDYAAAEVGTLGKLPAWYTDQPGEFCYEHLARVSDDEGGVKHLDPHNLPHCMPVWRRALHDEHGYFDEARYGTFADWAFWLHVLRRGGKGYLLPEPLSFYYVNPESHNRRGEKLAEWHHRIEQEHLESFCLRLDGRQVVGSGSKPPSWQKAERSESETIRKLDLHGRDYAYGQHRNSFNTIIEHLEPLHRGDDGVLFLPFIERYFVWGDADGEANSQNPRPLDRDWIGILHSPFDAPPWFEPKVSPENFFRTPLWEQSFDRCRGLITLSKDLEADLQLHYPGLPTHSLLHPTNLEGQCFDMEAYLARPRVIQAGDWLRKLQAVYQLHAPQHEKIILFKHWTREFLQREIETVGDFRDASVEERDFQTNEEYDELLSSSVVLCLLYASAANNLVLECLVRHTPIIINPLPSVVEYLGSDYPLYARDVHEAESILSNVALIAATTDYLRMRCAAIDLSYEGFASELARSRLYRCI